MAEKAMPTFSFDTVACLTAALQESGTVLGNRHYEVMAQLDGERTASSFEHQFRKVKARAKELAAAAPDGKETPTPTKAKAKATTKNASKDADAEAGGKKRGRGKQATVKTESVGGDADIENGGASETEETKPSKKVKKESEAGNTMLCAEQGVVDTHQNQSPAPEHVSSNTLDVSAVDEGTAPAPAPTPIDRELTAEEAHTFEAFFDLDAATANTVTD